MPRASATTADLANFGGAETCTPQPKKYTPSDLQVAITKLIKAKFPAGTKAWAYLMEAFDLKERAAKHRLSNSVSYTIEELQALIQGEDGFEYLQTLMADAEPKWWWWAKRVIATAERRRMAAELDQEILKLETSRPADTGARRRIKGDLDASKSLGAKFARAETTLGLLDSYSNRASTGAMAQTQAQTQGRGGRR